MYLFTGEASRFASPCHALAFCTLFLCMPIVTEAPTCFFLVMVVANRTGGEEGTFAAYRCAQWEPLQEVCRTDRTTTSPPFEVGSLDDIRQTGARTGLVYRGCRHGKQCKRKTHAHTYAEPVLGWLCDAVPMHLAVTRGSRGDGRRREIRPANSQAIRTTERERPRDVVGPRLRSKRGRPICAVPAS
ncbi:hypothetical protein LZ31DRAFT_222130 [Colletotrichum somersetense]|nr:hypothetical protein LZ31DRAFT_222130 [Colletotrichum somersetense]